jgi:hypothetical protein
MYIPINNSQGGGEDISLFSGRRPGGQKETFVKYRQIKNKDSTPEHCFLNIQSCFGYESVSTKKGAVCRVLFPLFCHYLLGFVSI